MRLSVTGGRRFLYRRRLGYRYAFLPEVPETRHIYIYGGGYESTESLIMSRWLQAGDVAIDCGANVGLIAAMFAQRTGPRGTVIAVECSPSTAEKLAAVIDALGASQVKILRMAIADRAGEVVVSDEASVSASQANAIQKNGSSGNNCCVVASTRIEDLLTSQQLGDPSLVKMDIEGAEPLAFRGWPSLATMDNPPLLVFEVYPRGLARLGFSPADIFEALPRKRYAFWHLNASWPNPRPEYPRGVPFVLADPFSHDWPLHSNVIAVPREGAFAPRASRLASLIPAVA